MNGKVEGVEWSGVDCFCVWLREPGFEGMVGGGMDG